MREIEVRVISPEAADHGAAEFWLDGALFGVTQLQDGELLLVIEPNGTGGPVSVNARSLHHALDEAKRLLESY
jgi:hypothetical protein